MNYTDKKIDELIAGIYSGTITVNNLPADLIDAIFNKLTSAFDEFKELPSKELLSKLTNNLYLFSEAKTYAQINDISLLADNELIKSFSDFKREALKIYDQYNKNWLETEYSTTIAQGQNAQRWEQIENQKKSLPYLEYVAVLDSVTSNICKPLDGIILPVNSSFWNSNSPANHFNCRCLLIQHDVEDATEKGITSDEKSKEIDSQIKEVKNPLFNDNVGKSGKVFPDNHPYFDKNGK